VKWEEDEEAGGGALAKVTAGRIWPYMKQDAHMLALGILGGILGGGTMPAAGAVVAFTLSIFYLQDPAEMRDEAAKYALVFCALGVAGFVGMTLLFYGIGSSGERMTTRLRNKTFVSILRHDAGWFDHPRHSTGNLVTHLADDCKKMQSAFGEQWGMQVQIFACLGVSITLGLFFSWRMGLVVIGTLPLNAMAGAMYMATMTGGNYKSGDDGKPSAAGALLSMAVNGMSTVTSLNLQLPLSEAYNALSEASIGPRTRRAFTGGLAFAFSGTVLYCSFALMFWFAAVLINNGHNSFKEVMAAIMALIYAAFGLGQASTTAGDQKAALEAARKIFSVIESAEALEIDALSEEGLRPEAVAGKVEFRDLHFAYPTRPNNPVYSGYSLVAEPGQTVALVGPSGGGKSTAMALLLRFYSPDKGQVLLDGRDIRDLNLGWLRRQVGYVGQEPVLFAGTIRENIVYGEDPAAPFTDEQVESAARDAFAHDFIAAQPAGYATDVGERSALLSGGQKQRVAIARALIRRPAVLLLDEATSALDNESEREVQQALDALQGRGGFTTLVIAHRLSTIRRADTIAVVAGGRVKEQGTHNELLDLQGMYYELDKMSNGGKSSKKIGEDGESVRSSVNTPGDNSGNMNSVANIFSRIMSTSVKEVNDDESAQEEDTSFLGSVFCRK